MRSEVCFKRRIGRDSGRAKCVTTSCWLKQLSSMAGRSGTANSAPKPARGQGPSVGDATPTFQRDGMEGSPQEMGAVGRLCRPRVMEKTICWRAKPRWANKTKVAGVSQKKTQCDKEHWKRPPVQFEHPCE